MNRAATLTSALAFTIVAVVLPRGQSGGAYAEDSPQGVANHVDHLLAQEIFGEQSSGMIAPQIDDETFIRRAYLDTVGEVPTVEDILSFSLDDNGNKRAKLVDVLLADEDYGKNWARYWRDVVFYRRTEDRALIAARSMETYMTGRLNKNMSWDDVAASFITAEGDIREVGATALFAAQAGRPEESVAELSRIFMGIQIQCAQCHDHPTDRWKREQFHQLAAFLPRVAMRPNRDKDQRSFVVSGQDQFGRFRRQNANNRYAGTAEHRMTDLAKPEEQGKVMKPVFFVTGQDLSIGATDAQRRNSLSDWITSRENPWFAKAFVNRMWSELVGEGFYEPVDDMGPDRIPTAPKTLDFLASQFIDNEYDVKWLFRTVMATEAYQRESRTRRNHEETPFLANCNQRLRGDQLYSSLVAALDLPDYAPRGGGRGYAGGGGPRRAMNLQFGYDPSEPREEISMSIPQALFIMNSPQINQAISATPRTSLGKLLKEIDSNEDLVVELYLKVLSREPRKKEIQTCLNYVRKVGDRNEAFEDVLWTLVNSTEFLHRK